MSSPARLAQSVEHQTFNLRVMGSSPISGGTSTCFFFAQSSLLAQGMIAAGFHRAKTTLGRTDDVVVEKYRRPKEKIHKQTYKAKQHGRKSLKRCVLIGSLFGYHLL